MLHNSMTYSAPIGHCTPLNTIKLDSNWTLSFSEAR
jgi:hypothetical protein